MRTRSSLVAILCLGSLAPSCSWSRFDDLRDEAPVVQLESPGGIAGFGARMASAASDSSSLLLVGGDPNSSFPLLAYDIGDDRPSGSPVDDGYCGWSCVSGDSLAPLRAAPSGHAATPPCFLVGVGERSGSRGLLARCSDHTDVVYPVPQDALAGSPSPADIVDDALIDKVHDGFIQHAASRDASPLVAAASLGARQAWFYPPGDVQPQPLPTPQAALDDSGEDFGSAVVVLALANGDHMVAVAAPRMGDSSLNGHVWLYRVERASSFVSPWGCLQGQRSGFGLYLAAGSLLGDPSDELLVADQDSLSVYDGSVLASSALADSCNASQTPPGAQVASLRCVDDGDVTGCGRTLYSFGRAVAIGDVDGDAVNEVIVGMGELDVDGNGAAGALLVYRVDPDAARTTLLETRRLASPSGGEGIGTSVATVRVGSRDVIAAGAPGAASVFLFYCSTLGGAGRDSFRCP